MLSWKIVKRLQFACKCHIVTGAKICYGSMLSDLSIRTDRFIATSSGLQKDEFDCVVLTMPIPQLLQLRGDIVQLLGAYLCSC